MSRTIEKTLYKFHELSDDAKQGALASHNEHDTYAWSSEAIASIKALAEHFGGRLTNYGIDWLNPGRSSFKFDMPDDMPVKEVRSLLKELGTYNKRTGKGHGQCKLTGYCADDDCIDGFRLAFRNDPKQSLDDLMHYAGEELLQSACRDYEHQLSEEAFAESCEANGYEFDEHGNMA
jgi:hypothetical protein